MEEALQEFGAEPMASNGKTAEARAPVINCELLAFRKQLRSPPPGASSYKPKRLTMVGDSMVNLDPGARGRPPKRVPTPPTPPRGDEQVTVEPEAERAHYRAMEPDQDTQPGEASPPGGGPTDEAEELRLDPLETDSPTLEYIWTHERDPRNTRVFRSVRFPRHLEPEARAILGPTQVLIARRVLTWACFLAVLLLLAIGMAAGYAWGRQSIKDDLGEHAEAMSCFMHDSLRVQRPPAYAQYRVAVPIGTRCGTDGLSEEYVVLQRDPIAPEIMIEAIWQSHLPVKTPPKPLVKLCLDNSRSDRSLLDLLAPI